MDVRTNIARHRKQSAGQRNRPHAVILNSSLRGRSPGERSDTRVMTRMSLRSCGLHVSLAMTWEVSQIMQGRIQRQCKQCGSSNDDTEHEWPEAAAAPRRR